MSTQLRTKTLLTSTVFVKASPERIWEALTQPEWTVRYGYAPIVEYDLKPGGAYRAYPNEGMKQFPGVPDVICDGEVLEVEAPYLLKQTWRMLMSPDLAGEGFTELTHTITPVRSGVCRLTVTHDVSGAPKIEEVVSGRCLQHGAGGGWDEILSGLKTLLETGVQLPFLSGPEGCQSEDRRIAMAKRWANQSLTSMLTGLEHTPDDRLNWSPSGTSRSALKIAAHAAIVMKGIAGTIANPDGPSPSVPEVMEMGKAAEAGINTREEVVEAVKDSCAAMIESLDKLSAEQVLGQCKTPFGEMPMESWILIGSLHMDIHKSQIDYLQTIWGDLDPRM